MKHDCPHCETGFTLSDGTCATCKGSKKIDNSPLWPTLLFIGALLGFAVWIWVSPTPVPKPSHTPAHEWGFPPK